MIEPGQCPIEIIGDDLTDARSALGEIDHWLKPVGAARLARAFGEIDLVTGHEREAGGDRSKRIEVMARRLSSYPEDLVIAELRRYRGIYFPRLDEIRLPLEQSAAYRRRLTLRRAFTEKIRRLVLGETSEPRKIISDEERAAVSAGFRRLRATLTG